MKKHSIQLDVLTPKTEPSENFDISVDTKHHMLIIRVPLAGGGRKTRSNTNTLIATTRGNRLLQGTSLRVGLNVYEESGAFIFKRITTEPELDCHPDHKPPERPA